MQPRLLKLRDCTLLGVAELPAIFFLFTKAAAVELHVQQHAALCWPCFAA